MHGPKYNLAALVICPLLVLTSGCAQTTQSITGLFAKKKSNTELEMHVKTPDDRMKEWTELAKKAAKEPPAEQQRIVAELSKEMQQESDPRMKRCILRTLAAYPQPEALAVIVGALADSEFETRRMACTCLGKRGGKEAVQELTRVISSDTNHDVRLAAVRALGRTREATAVGPLAEALVDADPAMQTIAQESLAAVSGHDFGNNVQAWREFAATGKSEAPEVSLAERVRRMIY
jgi:HEAT repeat protein